MQGRLLLLFSNSVVSDSFTPGDPANLGIEPMSPTLAGGFFTTEPLGKQEGRLQGSY